ncbi:cytidine deaminase-like [Patiria miniata]|uniref:Cytidine deaminase n=1 Tax=Patiria miniata TaxID=46514 RepID=A0A914BFK3_PATMI|nr:cytidine deaminase-like [Patiria miniata]
MGDASLPAEIQKLIEKCHEAKKNAHCPYSKFRVGASLLTKDGKMYSGCNVENASYTLGLCAERCAIFKAVSEGHKEFKAMAVGCDVKDDFLAPCGACRQVMYEFGGKDLEVYLTKPDLTWQRTPMRELLPSGFDGSALTLSKVATE